jgi:hypothetical protein
MMFKLICERERATEGKGRGDDVFERKSQYAKVADDERKGRRRREK